MTQRGRTEPPVDKDILSQIKEMGWPELRQETWTNFRAQDPEQNLMQDPIYAAITTRLLRLEELRTDTRGDIFDYYDRIGALYAWEMTCGAYGSPMHTLGDKETQQGYLQEIRNLERIIISLS